MNKILIAFCVGSFLIGISNSIWNAITAAQNAKHRQEQQQLNAGFQAAKIQQLLTDEKVLRLVDDFGTIQDSIKSLGLENSRLRTDLRKTETNYLVLKNSLKVKTNFGDSSDYSILKNLPKWQNAN